MCLRITECPIRPLRRKQIFDRKLLLLQVPANPLVVTTEKLNRHIQGGMIYASLQGWGYISDAIEYRQDTEAEDEPQSAPDNVLTENTNNQEKTIPCRDCCRRGWQCICADLFDGEEYGEINHHRYDYNYD